MASGALHDDPDGLRGFVLAAGFGTRLAPVTDHVPKPLLPVGGRPLLDGIVDRLAAAGCGAVAVNAHHLAGQIGAWAAGRPGPRPEVFVEPAILGTGGALDNARTFLAGAPRFLLHNGDVLCDADLAALVADHRASGALATLLLADWPAVNSVTLGADGAVRHFGGVGAAPGPAAGDRALTYTGIAVCEAALLDRIGPGFSSLIAPLAAAVTDQPGAVRGRAPAGLAWDDLGTPGRWLARAGADAAPATGAPGLHLTRLRGHGSDRRFWRLAAGGWSAVAMASPPGDDEHERYLAVAAFLAARDLEPPRVLAEDATERVVLLEDLGGESLWARARTGPFPAAAYRAAAAWLARLQAATDGAAQACPAATDRALDAAALRAETAYFAERCLIGHCGLPRDRVAALAPEFDALAAAAAVQPRVLIHRDFQSQNLMLAGERVRPVDFQGMRLGPAAYDLASLVWDPYVDVPADERRALVTAFAALRPGLPDDAWPALVTVAGLQRVMQALGAYGFLGHVKGRTDFLAHIPGAWRRLGLLLEELAGIRSTAGPDVARFLPPPLDGLTALVASAPLPEATA